MSEHSSMPGEPTIVEISSNCFFGLDFEAPVGTIRFAPLFQVKRLISQLDGGSDEHLDETWLDWTVREKICIAMMYCCA